MTIWKVKVVVGSEMKELTFTDHMKVMKLIALLTEGAKYCHFAVEKEETK